MALAQAQFRVGIDELTESTHGWYNTQNIDLALNVDTTFLVRFLCQASGGVAHNNIVWQFQYELNGGAWVAITTTSNFVRAVPTVAFTTGDNCTNRLTGGTGTFESSAAGCTETGTAGGANCDIVANGFTETECAMQLRGADLAATDGIRIFLKHDGVNMDSYNQQLAIDVLKGGSSPHLRIQTPAMISLLMR